ncbi:hypothetical protein GCM10018980_04290 [Streptomyces capoamus]|uniref:Uncharacterized protein n=1 Tax=Streptomyces capoamus TaxID=68183 RepID=A0A919BZL8_9ACTN|nr:hypothetical protein [Streptomyces capoamus]GGW12423.1 hypothetical protein GCM10010501_12280 [Streptomyces libani subsp. rufus]GHG34575.1 hypothetical protein GCM10018980_04290 [Streptomyces capoamus]
MPGRYERRGDVHGLGRAPARSACARENALTASGHVLRFLLRRGWSRLTRIPRSEVGRQLSGAVSKGLFTATSLPLLGMGRDMPTGRMRLRYRLFFTDAAGQPLTLSGCKIVDEDSGHGPWADTTTLHTRILRGTVPAGEEADAQVVATGVLRLRLPDLVRELASFRVRADTTRGRLAALGRFGQFFAGRLWDVYVQDALAWSPV